MSVELTVEGLPDEPDAEFVGVLDFFPSVPGVPVPQYYVAKTLGTFGVRSNGTTYWTDGPVPRDEQACLIEENNKFYVARAA